MDGGYFSSCRFFSIAAFKPSISVRIRCVCPFTRSFSVFKTSRLFLLKSSSAIMPNNSSQPGPN